MAKRNDLKKRLKAADRRRNRRQAAQGSVIKMAPSEASVSPSDMIVDHLLAYASTAKSPSDIVARAALKACFRGDLPSKEPARGLAMEIEKVASQPGVTARAYTAALKELSEAAAQHQKSQKETPDAFLAYLAILAGSV